MGEPAGQHAAHARAGHRGAGRVGDRRQQGLEIRPGASGFECLGDHRMGGQHVPLVGHPDERRTPGAHRPGRRVARAVAVSHPVGKVPAMVADDLHRSGHRRVQRMVGGLETEQQQPARRRGARVEQRLHRVQQPAVGRIQPGLRQRPGRRDRPGVVGEDHRRRRPPARPALQPQPRLGDHPQGALRAQEQGIRRRPGPGTGQPAGLADTGRGDHPQRLGEVVDVGVDGGEVPAGAGRQPPADGGELEGLREVPQREPVAAQPVLQRRTEDTGLDAGRAADRVDLEHLVHGGEVQRDDPGMVGVAARFDAADHRTAPAERDHRNPFAAAPVQHVDHLRLVGRPHHQVHHLVDAALEAAHHVAERLAVAVPQPVSQVGGGQRGQRRRRRDPGFGDRQRLRLRRGVRGEVGLGQQGGDPAQQPVPFGGPDRVLDVAPAPPGSGFAGHMSLVRR